MGIKKKYEWILGYILIFIVYTLIQYVTYSIFGGEIIDFTLPSAAVIGLIFGPYGAITAAFSSIFYDWMKAELTFPASLEYFLLVLLYGCLCYKLWYGILLKNDSRDRLKLNSTHNLVKFIFVCAVLALVVSLYYNQGLNLPVTGYSSLTVPVMDFLNAFTFSVVMGMGFILLFRYLDVPFYYPGHFGSNIMSIKLHGNGKIFDYVLILAIIAVVLLNLFTNIKFVQSFLLLFALGVYLFKPLKPVNDYKKVIRISNRDIYIKNKPQSLFENLVLFAVILFLLVFAVIFILADYHVLIPLHNLNNQMSSIVYSGLTVAFLLIPFVLILNFFEKNFARPLGRISKILSKYIENDEITVDIQDADRYSEYLSQNSEIGTLSGAILKMFRDIEDYVSSIKVLNKEKEKIEAELSVAHNIQNSFLPVDFDIGGDNVDLSAIMLPAKSVGGDFYDFFMIGDGRFAFIVGDVSDKGIPAALFMSKSIQLFESYLQDFLSSGAKFDEVMYMINNKLCQNNESCMFLTAWVGIVDFKSGQLDYINAGHEYPIARINGKYKFLENESDLALGVMEDMSYTIRSIDLSVGDKILLFTDGVTDANNENGEFFGENQLFELFSQDKSVDEIKEYVFDFMGDSDQFDDFTLLMMEYKL